MKTLSYQENSKFRQVYHENLYLKKYLKECIKSFERVETELRKEFKENEHLMNRKISDSAEITKLLDMMVQENYSLQLYPTFILSNLLLSVYSIFETSLIRLIRAIDNLAKPEEEFHPKSGDLLNKALKHIKINTDFEMVSIGKDWNCVDNLSLLRNFIVHYNGDFKLFQIHNEKKSKHLYNLVEKDPCLRFSQEGKVVITAEAIIHRFASSCERLLHKTATACEEKFKTYSYTITYSYDENIHQEERKLHSKVRII